jgi:ribokinase
MAEATVVVSGYTSIDTSIRTATVPRPGETAVVTGDVVPPPRWGGCAPNVALWLRRLEVPTALVGWLGDDPEGRDYRDVLATAGVDLRGLETGEGSSPRSFLIYPTGGDTLCLFHPSGSERQRFDDASLVGKAGWVAVTVGPEGLTRSVLDAFGSRLAAGEVRLGWDVKADRHAFSPDLVERLAGADLVCLNRAETAYVGEALGLGRAAEPEDLLGRGARAVALTRGPAGARVVWEGGREELQPEPESWPDPTGAGDAFFAGMLAGLSRGEPPPNAGRIGMRAASGHLREADARVATGSERREGT